VADATAGLLGPIAKLRDVREGDVWAGSYSQPGREDDLKAERSCNVHSSHTIYVRAVPSATSNFHYDPAYCDVMTLARSHRCAVFDV
jgi:hypothetical protein